MPGTSVSDSSNLPDPNANWNVNESKIYQPRTRSSGDLSVSTTSTAGASELDTIAGASKQDATKTNKQVRNEGFKAVGMMFVRASGLLPPVLVGVVLGRSIGGYINSVRSEGLTKANPLTSSANEMGRMLTGVQKDAGRIEDLSRLATDKVMSMLSITVDESCAGPVALEKQSDNQIELPSLKDVPVSANRRPSIEKQIQQTWQQDMEEAFKPQLQGGEFGKPLDDDTEVKETSAVQKNDEQASSVSAGRKWVKMAEPTPPEQPAEMIHVEEEKVSGFDDQVKFLYECMTNSDTKSLKENYLQASGEVKLLAHIYFPELRNDPDCSLSAIVIPKEISQDVLDVLDKEVGVEAIILQLNPESKANVMAAYGMQEPQQGPDFKAQTRFLNEFRAHGNMEKLKENYIKASDEVKLLTHACFPVLIMKDDPDFSISNISIPKEISKELIDALDGQRATPETVNRLDTESKANVLAAMSQLSRPETKVDAKLETVTVSGKRSSLPTKKGSRFSVLDSMRSRASSMVGGSKKESKGADDIKVAGWQLQQLLFKGMSQNPSDGTSFVEAEKIFDKHMAGTPEKTREFYAATPGLEQTVEKYVKQHSAAKDTFAKLSEIEKQIFAEKGDIDKIVSLSKQTQPLTDQVKKQLTPEGFMAGWGTGFMEMQRKQFLEKLDSHVDTVVRTTNKLDDRLAGLKSKADAIENTTDLSELNKLVVEYGKEKEAIQALFPRDQVSKLANSKALGLVDADKKVSEAKQKMLGSEEVKEAKAAAKEAMEGMIGKLSACTSASECLEILQDASLLKEIKEKLAPVPSTVQETVWAEVFESSGDYEELRTLMRQGKFDEIRAEYPPETIEKVLMGEICKAFIEMSGPHFSKSERPSDILKDFTKALDVAEKMGVKIDIGNKIPIFKDVISELSVRAENLSEQKLQQGATLVASEIGIFLQETGKRVIDGAVAKTKTIPFPEEQRQQLESSLQQGKDALGAFYDKFISTIAESPEKEALVAELSSGTPKKESTIAAVKSSKGFAGEGMKALCDSSECNKFLDNFKEINSSLREAWASLPEDERDKHRMAFTGQIQDISNCVLKSLGSPVFGLLNNTTDPEVRSSLNATRIQVKAFSQQLEQLMDSL